MTLEQLAAASQIAGTVLVVLSLLFVGMQIRQNTAALVRAEHNSTMSQWTVIRMAIAQDRDVAELMTAGLQGARELDAADRLRLEQFLAEHVWAGFHIWDRTQRGVFPPGTFEQTGGPLLAQLLRTERGAAWWRGAKGAGYIPAFVADLDAVLAKDAAPVPATSKPARAES